MAASSPLMWRSNWNSREKRSTCSLCWIQPFPPAPIKRSNSTMPRFSLVSPEYITWRSRLKNFGAWSRMSNYLTCWNEHDRATHWLRMSIFHNFAAYWRSANSISWLVRDTCRSATRKESLYFGLQSCDAKTWARRSLKFTTTQLWDGEHLQLNL